MAGKSLNRVQLIGNLGKDPEVKYTPSGTAVAKLTIATNERFKDKSGEWHDRTEWHNVVLWQRLAEIAGEYFKKGGKVYIEGRLQTRSWDDSRPTEEVHDRSRGQRLDPLGGRGEGGEMGGYSRGSSGNNNFDQSVPEPANAGCGPDQRRRYPVLATQQVWRGRRARAPPQHDAVRPNPFSGGKRASRCLFRSRQSDTSGKFP